VTNRKAFINFLRANWDISASKPVDMPVVPKELIEHCLKVDPKATPKKQRLRRFAPNKREAIKKELAKLLTAGFIKEVYHPECVANPILVLKKNNNEWRMCVDYTDLNKHCTKDPFTLPSIDQVIDSKAGCVLLSFLNCYLGYHQIALKEEEQIKTVFITPFGAYAYTTMSFGLNNAGATYQWSIQLFRCRVILVIARSNRYPDIQPWRVTATGFRHQDTYPLTVRKALRYLCQIFERHLAPTPVRFFPPAIITPVWEARMRSLERRRQEEGPLYQVATYLAALDQLFDEQANLLREQTHRAEQAELAVRLQPIRAAQAEARAAAAVSSEAVAQESLRQARDRRMQEWTRSGTPVPAIGEDHVLLETPVIGWGPLFGNSQAPSENPESSATAVERDGAAQPLANGNP
jgi:hypothetical protein